MDASRANNYDLIRLVSAAQVLYIHGVTHLKLRHPLWLVNAIKLFPGVPIFFFLSGVLISMSWERQPNIRGYARNRILRIYPGLIVCTAVSIGSVFVSGYLWNDRATIVKLAAMLLGQVTVAQFFTPAFMRGYGSGAFNGSLGTVTTELQFYVLLPLLYLAFRFRKRNAAAANWVLGGLTLAFLTVNIAFHHLGGQQDGRTLMKIFDVSFLPWFYMFLLGVLVQRNMARILPLVRGRGLGFLAFYVAVASGGRAWFDWQVSNAIHPILFALLAAAVLSLAYTRPNLSSHILRHNDISYGLYIYHMPVYNFIIHKGGVERNLSLFLAFAASSACAVASWNFVERPALRRKRHTAP